MLHEHGDEKISKQSQHPMSLQVSLTLHSVGLRLAYVFLRKPDVSQLSESNVNIGTKQTHKKAILIMT